VEEVKEVKYEWDAFICHATEDKQIFVGELTKALREKDVRVWYDEFELKVGDSLQEAVSKGTRKSRYGIVIISPNFYKKDWPQKELKVLMQRDQKRLKVILPVWLNIDYEEVYEWFPLIADTFATKAESSINWKIEPILIVYFFTTQTTVSVRFDNSIEELFSKHITDRIPNQLFRS